MYQFIFMYLFIRLDYLCKISIKITVAPVEGNSRNQIWTLNKKNWSSYTKLVQSASWTHGLIAQWVRASEELRGCGFKSHYIYIYLYLSIYIYIYISISIYLSIYLSIYIYIYYIYIYIYTYIYGIHQWRIVRGSYRKLLKCSYKNRPTLGHY